MSAPMSVPYRAALSHVFNRGRPPVAFLDELVAWAKSAPGEIFAPNKNLDIYSKVFSELGPWESPLHRKAVMTEVLRVLAMFESSGNWKEGTDSSRRTATTNDNAEAGAWQESWDARRLDTSLSEFLKKNGIADGVTFQQRMKNDHIVAMTFTALLLRIDVKDYDRIANGPVRKGDERKKTWPDRPKLWTEEESIYPWLRRAAVSEFIPLLG